MTEGVFQKPEKNMVDKLFKKARIIEHQVKKA